MALQRWMAKSAVRGYHDAGVSRSLREVCDRTNGGGGGVTAEYSKKDDGDIRVVNTCVTQSGEINQSVGTAKIVEKSTNAKLKVTFFWPFYGNYWVIDLGDNYEYAVVGEPSRDYLWILSRTPMMPDSVYRKITDGLTAKGYQPSKLVKTRQTGAR